MGGRLTCQACSPLLDPSLITVHAELFTLSGKKTKWIKLHADLLEVRVSRVKESSHSSLPLPSLLPPLTIRLHALTSDGNVVIDTRVLPDQSQRLSECFVQTVDVGGRTLGVNLVSPLEAQALLHAIATQSSPCSPPPPPVSLSARGQSTLARIRVLAQWNGEKVVKDKEPPQTTVVLITPVFLVFHYGTGLVHINLLESVYDIVGQHLRLTAATRTWELAVADPTRMLTHILNQSSQILAKTSSRLGAAIALRAKMRQLRTGEMHARRPRTENRLRMAILEQRIACLEGRLQPVLMPRLPDIPLQSDDSLSTLFLYLVNARGLNLWDTRHEGSTCSCVEPMVAMEKKEGEKGPEELSVEGLTEEKADNDDRDEGVASVSDNSSPIVDSARLKKAIDEVVTTEREYVAALRKMVSLFLPLDQVRQSLGCSLRLLCNQEKLLQALEEAYAPLEEHESCDNLLSVTSSIGRVFSSSCSHLKVYAEYAAAYLRFQRNIGASPELLAALKELNPGGEHSSSYESQMIRPVQRVAQYPLLLENVACAVRGSGETSEVVEQAEGKMRALVHYVNEMQRIEEHLSPRLKHIKATHAQLLLSKGLRMDMGDLLMLIRVEWQRTTAEVDCFLFVYSSLLLLLPASTHAHERSVLLPLDEVSVQEASEDSLLLIHVPLFSASSPLIYHVRMPAHARKHLVKHIKKARQSPPSKDEKRKIRPVSGSSKSDGGYGSDHSPVSHT